MTNTIQADMTSKLSPKNYIIILLRILLAGLFLLSAVSKLYPSPHFALTTFEIKQLLPLGFSETLAAYFSRTLIGCELALGFLLLQKHYYKRLVLPGAFLLLLVFTVHLTYEVIAKGNVGNCGCFGALMPMTPIEAIIKNIIAMAICIVLFIAADFKKDKLNFFFGLSVLLASILFIYLVGPMQQKTTKVAVQTEEVMPSVTEDINPDSLIKALDKDTVKIKSSTGVVTDEPKMKSSGYKNFFSDIDKGRKILCFFAPSCEHCKELAKELTQLRKEVAGFPDIRIVFMDEEAEVIPDFFAFAGANYPYQITDIATFWKTLGSTKDTPGVLYLWNGNLIKEYDGIKEKKFVLAEFKQLVTKQYSEIK